MQCNARNRLKNGSDTFESHLRGHDHGNIYGLELALLESSQHSATADMIVKGASVSLTIKPDTGGTQSRERHHS